MITALPDAATAERSVLGAALSDENARDVVLDRLTPEMFTVSTHRAVLDALCALDAKGAPTDVVSVSEHLKGGPAEDLDLPGLIMDCPTTDDASVGWWAKIIADAYTIRRLAGIGSEIIELARTTSDPSEALVHAEALLQDATPTSSGSTIPVAEAATIALDELTNPERSPGLSTGLEALDRRLGGGLHDGRLYLIAARPGMGKTALGHQIAAASARAGRPALVVTLEMSATEVAQRLLTVEAKIDHSVFNTGTDNTEHLAKLDAAVGRIAAWPLELIDSTSATVPMIRAAARQIRSTHGDLGVIVIDYLQLMVQGGADNRQALVAEVSRSLKILARTLGVPVVALSQLSRTLEARADKRPTLPDLRESGSLEQDSDVVLFIYRDDYYDVASPDRGIAELIAAKVRHGVKGSDRVLWAEKMVTFLDMLDSTSQIVGFTPLEPPVMVSPVDSF